MPLTIPAAGATGSRFTENVLEYFYPDEEAWMAPFSRGVEHRHLTPSESNHQRPLLQCSRFGGPWVCGELGDLSTNALEDGRWRDPESTCGKGRCIWYGRVELEHVREIIEEMVRNGRRIEKLLGGVHDMQPRLMDRGVSVCNARQAEEPELITKSHLAELRA